MKKLLLVICLLPTMVMAAAPTNSIVIALNNAAAYLASLSGGMIITIIASLVELAIRLFPTSQPMSLLLVVGQIFDALSGFMNALAGLMDKIIPQNLSAKKK